MCIISHSRICVHVATDDDIDDDDDDDTPTAATTVTSVVAASNGPMNNTVDDKLVKWLSSCDAAQDEILRKVSIR